jgi:hypothetical protein
MPDSTYRRGLTVFALGVLAWGCGPRARTDGGTDAVATTDTASTDAPASDAPGTDVPGTDVLSTMDSDIMFGTGPCARGALIDLASVAPGPDGAVRFMGDTRTAPAMGFTPPMLPMCSFPMGTAPDGAANLGIAYQVVLRYVMRSTATLTATTVDPATDTFFDTAVLLSSTCGSAYTVIACNDDTPAVPPAPPIRQSTVTTPAAIPAGTSVYIVVGGYHPPTAPLPDGGTWTASGRFNLVLREMP